MFQQITKGIKISVKTTFNHTVFHKGNLHYAFSYYIQIENNSKHTVKLTERFWTILDSLNNPEYVEGEGVVGQTPTLTPNDIYNYRSNCLLLSNIGAMKGKYKMTNLDTLEDFFVTIPTFQLNTTPILN